MEKVMMIIFSALVVCIVTVAPAQVSDTASLNYNNQSTVKDSHNEAPAIKEKTEQNGSQVGESSGVREGTISSEHQAQQLPKPTEEQTDQNISVDDQPASGSENKDSKREKKALKKGNAYYKDDAGKKGKQKKDIEKKERDND